MRINPPVTFGIDTEITLPLSKSVANRLLVMSFIAGNEDKVALPAANDSQIMYRLLKRMRENANTFDAEDAGTVFRFLCALFAVIPGTRILTGSERMLERPCMPLVEALKELGADIQYLGKEGYPPLRIHGKALKGNEITINSSISSQFVSALMMVAPLMEGGLVIRMDGNTVSLPYIMLTAGLMKQMGQEVSVKNDIVMVRSGKYVVPEITSEPDWSAASYWYAFMALSNCRVGKYQYRVRLRGLRKDSFQGDKEVAAIFEKLGVETEWSGEDVIITNSCRIEKSVRFDLTGYPDLAPAVAVACAGLKTEAMLTGLDTLAIKESNRLAALKSELNKLGFGCSVVSGNTLILPGTYDSSRESAEENIRESVEESIRESVEESIRESNVVETYNDHRIAMAMSLLSLKTGSLVLHDPMVVKKSYPSFWDDLEKAGFGIIV